MVEIPAEIPRNRFQIVGQLGRGTLADVYLCKLRGVAGFEKEVVVKRIRPNHAADPLVVRMFLDEARVAARLNHPNIVQVFEVGEEEGLPYIAMEYVRGVTLGMVIRRAHQERNIHHGHFAQLIARICDAFSYAHGALDEIGEPVGLVEREVSPASIVINFDGVPKLLDFGMAAAKDRMLTGERRCRVPEQASRGRLDHRADVFSLGLTLFELTTGFNPFGAPGQKDRDVRQLRDLLEVFAASQENLSTPRSLAAWIRELFPDFSTLTRPRPPARTMPGNNASAWRWIALAAGGLAVAAAVWASTPTELIARGQRGPVVSAVPKAKIPIPTLPREYVPRDVEQLARVCQAVEESTILAGVSPRFARGITASLRERIGPNTPVYPIAMYYYIVTEAALKRDNVTAGTDLASAHASGHLINLKNMPGVDKPL